MSVTKTKTTKPETVEQDEIQKEFLLLEQRKTKAMEKIANSLDALTVWFEEVDKDEWSARIQYYLAEYHNKFIKGEDGTKPE
jgi:ATP adenylyltransferase/5',5'''-P-1,P-4-tetraphosphate phosphorylase II